jgi:hypothetical protein
MTKQEKPAPHGVGFLFAASRNLERRSKAAARPAASASFLPPSVQSTKKGEGVATRCLPLGRPDRRRMGVQQLNGKKR